MRTQAIPSSVAAGGLSLLLLCWSGCKFPDYQDTWGDDDDTTAGDDDTTSDDDDTTEDLAPTITGIDGDGPQQDIDDALYSTVQNPQEAQHRIAQGWQVSGSNLLSVDTYQLAADGWVGPTYTNTSHPEFQFSGGTDVQRNLTLPSALVAGAFVLTLSNDFGDAQAQVYVLQGLACWDTNGNGVCDEPGEGGGDGCDASDCQGAEGPQGLQGIQGDQGDPGTDGLDCWDTNGNGICDVGTEDGGNGSCDAADCQGPEGPQGTQGIQGVQGDPGQDGADGGNCWDLIGDANNDGFTDADDCQPGANGCPAGYDNIDTSLAGGAICQHPVSGDEMVQVGDFWIDRYEMSIWSDTECTTGQKGSGSDDYDGAGFPDNGNWTSPLYACSVSGVTPSRYMTWFQAQQSCELSGKDLCNNEQWQAAAAGTTVPGCNTGGAGGDEGCNGSPDPWTTGDTQCGGCESAWGAVDMVGNLWEWAAHWQQAGMTWQSSDGQEATGVWGADYGDDSTWNVNGAAYNGTAHTDGLPAAAFRGGSWATDTRAGVFALYLSSGPSDSITNYGARCCRQK